MIIKYFDTAAKQFGQTAASRLEHCSVFAQLCDAKM